MGDVSIRLEDDLDARLERVCKKLSLPKATYIRMVLVKALDKEPDEFIAAREARGN